MAKKSKLEWRRKKAADAIVSLLAASKKPLSISRILRELQFEHQIIFDSLKTLTNQGTLARSGSGHRGSPFYFMLTSSFFLAIEETRKDSEEKRDDIESSEYLEITI